MTTMPPRTVVVDLLMPDDEDSLAALEETLSSALMQQGTALRQGDESPAREAARAFDDFLAEASERAVKATVKSLPRKEFAALKLKHPARPNEPDDWRGFNVVTFGDDLVPACVVEPEYAAEEFLDSLSDGMFSRLYSAALDRNLGAGDVPKGKASEMLSRVMQDSGDTSASLDR